MCFMLIEVEKGEKEMVGNLSARLVLLRREKGISQKKAAQELGVSQALLSHYERGIRECGMDFLLRACDYYDVSADYILGRSMQKNGDIPSDAELAESDVSNKLNGMASVMLGKRLVINAVNVLYDIAAKHGGRSVVNAMNDMFYLFIYKCFRYFYDAGNGNAGFLTLSKAHFPLMVHSRAFAAEMKLGDELEANKQVCAELSAMSHDDLTADYPASASALLHVLNNAEQMVKAPGRRQTGGANK